MDLLTHIRELTIKTLLRMQNFDPQGRRFYSVAAVNLIVRTAIHESDNFRHVVQVGGPAVSYFQLEPDTIEDLWGSYLMYRPALATAISDAAEVPEGPWSADQVLDHLPLAVALCRLKYWRAEGSLPAGVLQQADYWKQHYNSDQGRGTIEKFIKDVDRVETDSPANLTISIPEGTFDEWTTRPRYTRATV